MPQPTRRAGSALGVIVLQGLTSLGTLVQLAVFGQLLEARHFDVYAVWITAGMFLAGMAQAAGTERVVIGRRTVGDGRASARALGLVTAVVSLLVAALLGWWPLCLAAMALYGTVRWDFERFTQCFDRPWFFVVRDVATLAAQVVATLVAAHVADREAAVVVWWALAGLAALVFARSARAGEPSGSLVSGLQVLCADRETVAVMIDSGLGGMPFLAALWLVSHQGDPGQAAGARLAVTLLGPISIAGLAARRLLFSRLSQGALTSRERLRWFGLSGVVGTVCVPPLLLSWTPLWGLAFGDVPRLAVASIVLFALNYALLFLAMLPNGEAKAAGRARSTSRARLASSLAAVVACLCLLPLRDAVDVGAVLVVAATVNLLWLVVAGRMTSAQRRERRLLGRYS